MDELVHALDVLSALVRSCHGPCAEEALLFSPPDPPVVTADGHALLVAWRRGLRENRSRSSDRHEPMQTLVLDAAESLYLQIGDGASEFVLLLHGAVTHAVDAIRLGRSQWGRSEVNFRQLATAFGKLKRECGQMLIDYSEWQPDLRMTTPISFTKSTGGKLQPSEEFHAAIVRILQSGLSGLLGEQALDFLVQLVVKWLFTPPIVLPHTSNKVDAQFLFQRVLNFLKRAPDMVTVALASSLFGSHVVPPDEFILRKSLVPLQLPSMLSILKPDSPGLVRFICFTCALSLTEGANHVTIRTKSDAELFSAADAARLFITNYLSTLYKKHGIRLLVSTEQLEDSVTAICTRLGIACVQYAEKDDVFDLGAASGVYPLASLFDEIHDGRHVGVCRGGVASVRLQQSAGLWFRGLVVPAAKNNGECQSRDTTVAVVVPQLVLKAPTKGVYKLYFKVVVKALRILLSWWEPSSSNLQQSSSQFEFYSCRGGGATELAIARHLDAQHAVASAMGNEAIVTQLARKIFANALRDVVVVLRSNMSVSEFDNEDGGYTNRASKRIVLQDLARLALHNTADDEQQGSSSPALYGYVFNRDHRVETLGGVICIPQLEFCDPKGCGLLHPWRRIDSLIHHVLQTLEQLFRVDCIIPTTSSHKPLAEY